MWQIQYSIGNCIRQESICCMLFLYREKSVGYYVICLILTPFDVKVNSIKRYCAIL